MLKGLQSRILGGWLVGSHPPVGYGALYEETLDSGPLNP